MNDMQLIARFKDGDMDAFDALFEEYRLPLHSFLTRMVQDKEAASDILQETFMRFIKNIKSYKEEGKFRAWIFTTANNLAVNHMQRKGIWKNIVSLDDTGPNGTSSLAEKLISGEAGPENSAQTRELGCKIKTALAILPPEQRQVLVLREFSGLSFKEIAQVLDCPIGTALTRMSRALSKLRTELKEYDASY